MDKGRCPAQQAAERRSEQFMKTEFWRGSMLAVIVSSLVLFVGGRQGSGQTEVPPPGAVPEVSAEAPAPNPALGNTNGPVVEPAVKVV